MITPTILLVIAFNGYQPAEYGITRKVLEDSGFKVVVASNQTGTAHAMPTGFISSYNSVHVDIDIQTVKATDYEGIFFIGGAGVLEVLNTNYVHQLLQNAYNNEIPVGAICIAPRILAYAGILTDKSATGWDGDKHLDIVFKDCKVNRVNNSVVVDGKIITADGPMAAESFGKAIVKIVSSAK